MPDAAPGSRGTQQRTPRRLTRRGVAFTLVALVAALAAAGCSSGGDADDGGSDEASDTARYRPAGDEGLGASVAILLDHSGSMRDNAPGDDRPKYVVAREAIEAMLAATDSVAAAQPDVPINVGVFAFSSEVHPVVPIARYDRAAIRAALDSMELPVGGTAIGAAMDAAREALYRAGTIRKYILVVTDGENTEGRSPARAAREIARRSEGAVKMYFVAFDIAADKFAFVRQVRGEVVSAGNGPALRTSLDRIYRGKILAEAADAGETLPDSSVARPLTPPSPPTKRSP